jgi:hypothetical protein
MRTLLKFVHADFAQVGKVALITWVCFALIHVGQTSFHPSFSVLALSLPMLLLIVGFLRAIFFCLFYFLNNRDFAVAYAKLRGPTTARR